MSTSYVPTYLAKSTIQGQGLFTQLSLQPDQPIGVGIQFYLNLVPIITSDFGTMINHSWTPNTYLRYNWTRDCYEIIAKVAIPANAELTLDYRETPWFIVKPDPNWR